MASMAVQTSSNSSKKYDVFLSFRGADTRTKFTDHLYNALQVREGIPTFRDSEELEKGQDLSQLFEAIEKSTIAVVILSSNYASSTWCLREVAKIVECRNKSGLIVLPVFYEIEPTQVRYQSGKFKNYFDEHEQKFKDTVQIWRQALAEVAGLVGWDLKDRSEVTVIDEIVKCVDKNWKLKFNLALSTEDSKDFVGMDRVREIELGLDIKGLDNIGVIGICGMPGVGKTTIAEVVFRRNWHHFEANSFIANVGERRKKNGLLHIQNQLYHDLLDSKVITMNDVPAERRKLRHKKVFIILDGVTELEYIFELVGRGGEELINWFGRGSIIIITTIDEKLLKDYEAKIHKVDRLTENEARLLFFRKAFKKDHPLHDFAELDFKSKIDHSMRQYAGLSYKFVDLADGLPLAIVALGNLLLNRTLDEWKAELCTLEANNYTGDEKLFGVLKVCIDGLRDGGKEIFLDIACFFKGDDKKRAERIFESCGHNPGVNLNILLEKSLVTIVGGKLWMHDLLQETGQKMVIGQSKLLGERSRLWHHKEAISVLKQDKGTSAVRGIFLSSPRPDKVRLKADSFSNMDFLRLLKIKNVIFSGCLEYDLSNELSFLEWHGFPSTSLPSNFEPEKLVELHLPQSQIKQLWEDITTPPLEKLVIIDLSDCKYLTSTPDLQSVPNLEILILKGCTRLSEVDLHIGDHLQKLLLLNLEGCESLSSLPKGICSLRSLTTLILSGCSKLANLPEKIGENMKQLSELDLDGTAIKELPASIKHLTGLIRLNLRDCKNLLSLPDIICSLTKLQVLNLSGCSKLDELPEKLGSLVGLKELDASRSCIRQVPSSILLLKDLESLYFRGCGGLQLPASFSGLDSLAKLDLSYCKLSDGAIPADLDCLSSLDHLNLSGNSLVSVPESITKLSKLEVLLLNDCSRLRSLPHLPSSIQRVFARNCPLLGTYSNKLTVWTSTATGFCFVNSQTSEERKLQRIPISEQHLLRPHLQKFYEDIIYKGNGFEYITPHTEIPSWFGRQNTGSSITILLAPEYFDGKCELMGFALCFVYEVQEHENMESTASNILAQEVKYSYKYSCRLSTCGGPDDDCPLLVCKLMDHDYVGSFRHWVYIAAGLFVERLNNRSIRAQVIIDRPGVEVKACGASLIYSGGVTEFVWNLNLRDEIPSHMRNLSSGDQSNEQEQETTDDHQLERKHVPVQYQAEMNRMISLFDTKARNKQSLDHDAGSSSTTASSTQVPHQRLERPESNDKSNELEQGTNNKTSTTIIGDQLRTNVESFLEELFELGGKARSNDIGFIFSLRAISQWFKHQSIGSAVTTRLPPELYNNKKWVGFALYVSFTLPPGDWLEKSCCFQSELYTGGHLHGLKLYPKAEDNFMGSHRLLVIHIPRERFEEQLNQCSIIQVNFVSSTPSVEVEMCGIRVVYEQDLKGLIRTITQCTIRSPPSEFNYGLSQLNVADGIGSFSSVFMTDNLIKAAKSSKRKLSTLQEPLRDSEFISGQKIHLKILAGTPYSTLKNKDSVVEWKRNLELLLESFCTLPDISIDLTLNESKINFSRDFDRPSISILLQKEIPEWFSSQHPSESMVSELPPNLERDVNFMGFVVCAAFSVHASEADVLKFLDSGHCPVLKCHLQSRSRGYPVRAREMNGVRPDNKFMWLYRRGFIFVIYLPRDVVKHLSHKVFELEVSFESDSSQVLAVQKCSLRLLYKQDVEEFKQTIIKCFTSVFDDADVIRLYIEEEDSGHNKRPNHADDRDSYGTTSSFGESRHARKIKLISKGETSGTGKKFPPVDLDSLKNRPLDQGQLLGFDRFSIYNCCFPPNEIVGWFDHNSNGPSVEIPLPPSSTDWIGLALCAYFEVLDRPTSNLDSLNPGNPHHLTCYFETETDGDNPEPLHAYCTSNEEFQWFHLGGFLWLSYIPRPWFLDYHQLNKCINLKATIASDGQGLAVLKCGLRLLYQHDEPEFKETIMHCKTSLLCNHINGKNKQHPGVSGETGSSGGNSVIEQTHKERIDIPTEGEGSSDVSADERDSYGTTHICQGETSGKSNVQRELVAHVVEEERASSTNPPELIPFVFEIEPSASTDSSSAKFEGDQFRESVESFLAELFRNKGNRNDLEYGFILSPRVGAILPWFSHQTIGSEALVLHIPPDLNKDKKWAGLSLYVAFTVPTGSENILCRCSLSTSAGHAEAITTACPQGNFSGSRQLCFIYKPRAGFPEQWNKSSYICAFFEVLTPVVEVEMCGAHLVYEQDLIGMIGTITHCTIRSPPVFYGVNKPCQSQRGQPFSDINMDTNLNELATRVPSTSHESSKSLVGQVIHLHIHGDTPFKKNDSVMEWEKKLELLLQCFFRFPLSVTLTLGGDVISSIGDSDPYCLCSSSIIPQKDIPTWFCGVKYPSYKLETRLPPNLENDDNWLGFVVCAAFSVYASEVDVLHYLDSGDYPKLTCHLQWGSERALNYKAGKETNIDLKNEFMWLYRRGFIWLRYIPHRKIKGPLNKSGHLEASFRTDSISSKVLGVQECSLRVLYKKDVEEFKQTIIQCFTSFFDNEDVIWPYIEDEDYGHNKWSNHADDRGSNGTTPVCQGETSGKSNDLLQLITHDVVEEGAYGPELMELIPFFIEIEPPASTDSSSTKITRQLRRNIESSLEQLFQGDNARHYDYGFILSPRVGAVMPWFSHQSIGREVEVTTLQPTELYKDRKWVGFSLYVAFTQPPDSAFSFICCDLSAFPGNTVLSIIHWRLCEDDQFSGSRRLCFIHIPRARLPEQCNNPEIFARFFFSNPATEVERCGIRVVYDEDIKGLIPTITQSTISNPPVFFAQHDKTERLPCGLPMTRSLVAHSKACFQPTRSTLRQTRGLIPSLKFGKVFLAIYGDTPFKQKDTIEWKRNFKLLVQSFFRLDLSIQLILGGGNIASYYDCLSQSCLFPQKEIPDWFTDKSLTATFVSTLPEDLESDKNWMGFVLCVAFSVHPHPTDVGNYKDSQRSSDVNCKFQWSFDSSQNISFREDIVGLRPDNKFMWLSRRGFIWMQFIPRRFFQYAMMNRSHRQLEASFNSGSPALSVQKCSLRILYKQDMQEYKQMFVQCFASVFDNLDHSQPYKEDDSQHEKEPIHEDVRIDSVGTTSLSEDTQHETKTTVPVPHSESSGNSFNRFNSILFEPILYDNKSAVIFADFRGWEE